MHYGYSCNKGWVMMLAACCSDVSDGDKFGSFYRKTTLSAEPLIGVTRAGSVGRFHRSTTILQQ